MNTALVTLLMLAPLAQTTQSGPAAWGFELRLGGYRPAVGDQTVPGTDRSERQYFNQFYGNKSPLLVALEFDRYLIDLGGPLGVAFQIGQWKASGKSRVCRDAAGEAVGCTPATIFDSTAGNDKTQVMIIPLALGAVYRFDLVKRKLGVPVVPYGKAGITYSYWRCTTGSGKTCQFQTSQGREDASGGTLGAHLAGGVALNLDWISTDGEIHNIFLDSFAFVELDKLWADGFGNEAKFDMSDEQLVFGLSFDFD
jgi:hypothetical protein